MPLGVEQGTMKSGWSYRLHGSFVCRGCCGAEALAGMGGEGVGVARGGARPPCMCMCGAREAVRPGEARVSV